MSDKDVSRYVIKIDGVDVLRFYATPDGAESRYWEYLMENDVVPTSHPTLCVDDDQWHTGPLPEGQHADELLAKTVYGWHIVLSWLGDYGWSTDDADIETDIEKWRLL